MIQLQPKQTFTVVRQISDPEDTTTYYVQAVIKKSSDGTTLATVNLDDNGGQRFTGNWEVVEDTSGEGYLVDVTTTVYTDSGYTTKSSNYSIENMTYLVAERWNHFLGGGGGGGSDISKNDIRKIVKAELKAMKLPEQKEVDLSKLTTNIDFIMEKLNNLYIPEPEKVDFTNVLTALNRVKGEIESKIDSIPEPEKINLQPVIAANKADNEKLSSDIKTMTDYLINLFKGNAKRIEDFMGETKNRFDISDKLRGVFNGVKGDMNPFPQEQEKKRERIRTKF